MQPVKGDRRFLCEWQVVNTAEDWNDLTTYPEICEVYFGDTTCLHDKDMGIFYRLKEEK